MENINETATTETESSNVVILDTPLMCGEQKIAQITLTKPNAGIADSRLTSSISNSMMPTGWSSCRRAAQG
ncbi:phage tail assembly protein [Erwinia sp. SLM-02]|uniref:phage tail assembly protein n=1 Tax=Erwinia sp. SLM-02 TaxID=3020057 RepID=UPI00307FF720